MTDSVAGLLQAGLLVALLAAVHVPLGDYMARVYTRAHDFRVERALYRVMGIDPKADQKWSTYLRSLFVERVAAPLFGFNVGIEAGQIVVLLCAAAVLAALDGALARVPLPSGAPTPLRLRVIGISTIVMLVASAWAVERNPWSAG